MYTHFQVYVFTSVCSVYAHTEKNPQDSDGRSTDMHSGVNCMLPSIETLSPH